MLQGDDTFELTWDNILNGNVSDGWKTQDSEDFRGFTDFDWKDFLSDDLQGSNEERESQGLSHSPRDLSAPDNAYDNERLAISNESMGNYDLAQEFSTENYSLSPHYNFSSYPDIVETPTWINPIVETSAWVNPIVVEGAPTWAKSTEIQEDSSPGKRDWPDEIKNAVRPKKRSRSKSGKNIKKMVDEAHVALPLAAVKKDLDIAQRDLDIAQRDSERKQIEKAKRDSERKQIEKAKKDSRAKYMEKVKAVGDYCSSHVEIFLQNSSYTLNGLGKTKEECIPVIYMLMEFLKARCEIRKRGMIDIRDLRKVFLNWVPTRYVGKNFDRSIKMFAIALWANGIERKIIPPTCYYCLEVLGDEDIAFYKPRPKYQPKRG